MLRVACDDISALRSQGSSLVDLDTTMLSYGCRTVSLAAVKESEASRGEGVPTPADAVDLVERVERLVAETASAANAVQVASLAGSTPQSDSDYLSAELLLLPGMEKYAGPAASLSLPTFVDLLQVPESAATAPEAVAALVRVDSACKRLLERAKDNSRSSRLVLQHQVIQLITSCFTQILPMPLPLGDTEACVWSKAPTLSPNSNKRVSA